MNKKTRDSLAAVVVAGSLFFTMTAAFAADQVRGKVVRMDPTGFTIQGTGKQERLILTDPSTKTHGTLKEGAKVSVVLGKDGHAHSVRVLGESPKTAAKKK